MIDFNEIKKAQFIQDFRAAEVLGREQEFLKANGIDWDIEKSMGEGSRGGKVIGHTKSGQPIYEHFDGKPIHELGTNRSYWNKPIYVDKKKVEAGGHYIGHDKRKPIYDMPSGKTKSGKFIYNRPDHEGHKDFTKEDHKDAAEHHHKKLESHIEDLNEFYRAGDYKSDSYRDSKYKYDVHKRSYLRHKELSE